MRPFRLTMVPLLDERRGVTYAIVFGIVWKTGLPLYPLEMYPDFSKPLLITQTIQLTCYAVGGVVGVMFLGWIVRQRRKV